MGELITKNDPSYGDYRDYDPLSEPLQVHTEDSEGGLVHHLQSLVTCPVCLGTIRTVPVFCCPSGHVTCTECRAQLSSCPVCRASYPRLELVSHVAAGIIDRIPHPCRFKSYGCSISLPLSSLSMHETKCSYRLVKCPNILCSRSISLAGLYRHMTANGCASLHQLKVTATVSSVFMAGKVRDLEEFQYKVPLVFSYEGSMFLISKRKTGNLVQFSASILGSVEQGRQFTVTICVFSEKMPSNVVEYKGFANSIDGPVWCSLSIHKDHMVELMDRVEENEFQQSLKYHYKVKISRNV